MPFGISSPNAYPIARFSTNRPSSDTIDPQRAKIITEGTALEIINYIRDEKDGILELEPGETSYIETKLVNGFFTTASPENLPALGIKDFAYRELPGSGKQNGAIIAFSKLGETMTAEQKINTYLEAKHQRSPNA